MRKRLKVFWLHSHFLYFTGGTKFIFEVSRRLAQKCDLEILVEKGDPRILKTFVKAGISVKTFGLSTSADPFYWIFLPLVLFFELKKVQAIVKNADVVISSMFPMNFLANKLGVPHIQYCFEPFAFFFDEDFIKGFSLSKKTFIKILKFLYSGFDISQTGKADKILTLNDVTAYWIKKVYGKRATTTQAGVNSDFFNKTYSSKISKKYKDDKIVIHSTDYSPVKGTDVVIRAFAKVLKKVSRAKLLITTTIEDRKAREKLENLAKTLKIKNRIDFLGYISYQLLPAYYSAARVYVSGSQSSKSGTTSQNLPVKEAMACETPAIRAPVTRDDVEDGVSGFLVNLADSAKLAEKIIFILGNPEIADKMGKKAREKIVRIFNWDKVSQKFWNQIRLNLKN